MLKVLVDLLNSVLLKLPMFSTRKKYNSEFWNLQWDMSWAVNEQNFSIHSSWNIDSLWLCVYALIMCICLYTYLYFTYGSGCFTHECFRVRASTPLLIYFSSHCGITEKIRWCLWNNSSSFLPVKSVKTQTILALICIWTISYNSPTPNIPVYPQYTLESVKLDP